MHLKKHRHQCLLLFLTVITVTVGSSDCFAQSAKRKANLKPNFVLFLTDDQGYNDVGCFGSPNISTPNFDRMAKEGMRFTSAYVGSPVCGPSRSALMTGSYPIRIAEPRNTKTQHTVPHTKELMIPEILKSAGYTSALIGKWHVVQCKHQR